MKVYKATAPSAWAAYLINGDVSGLPRDELPVIDAWLKRMDMGTPASCSDAGFKWYHDARIELPCGANCEEYVFLIKEECEA